MTPVSDLVGTTEFAIGLLMGSVAFLVALPAALGLGVLFPARGRRPGLVGPVFAVASVFALNGNLGTDEIASVPGEVVLGLLLVWLAGTIGAATRYPWAVGPIASLPGGFLIAGANAGLADGWVPVLIVLGIAVVGGTAADLAAAALHSWTVSVPSRSSDLLRVPDTEPCGPLSDWRSRWCSRLALRGGGARRRGCYAGDCSSGSPIEGIGRRGRVGVVGAFAPWSATARPGARTVVPGPGVLIQFPIVSPRAGRRLASGADAVCRGSRDGARRSPRCCCDSGAAVVWRSVFLVSRSAGAATNDGRAPRPLHRR
jgi:hypothetical protein